MVKSNPQHQAGHYNNVQRNPALTNFSQYLIIFAIMAAAFSTRHLIDYFKPEPTSLIVCLHDFPFQVSFGFIVPFVFYHFNPEAKVHVDRLFWENCPRFLDRFNPDMVQPMV